jgi:tRNA A37 threonylcarbamoyladenosine modification protein TsaB
VESLDEPAHISPQAMVSKYGGYHRLTWAGEGAHAQLELLRAEAVAKGIELTVDAPAKNTNGWMVAPPAPRLAENVARLALREWRKGNVMEPERLRANYVRASDAEIKIHA